MDPRETKSRCGASLLFFSFIFYHGKRVVGHGERKKGFDRSFFSLHFLFVCSLFNVIITSSFHSSVGIPFFFFFIIDFCVSARFSFLF